MKGKVMALSMVAAVFFMLAGCAEKPVETGGKGLQVKETSQLSPAEQKERAYEILKQILELSKSDDREKELPEMKRLYRKIIKDYPDTHLAQESYLRLIILEKERESPAGDREAEKLHQEFLQVYPDSKLKGIVEDALKGKS